MFCNKSVYHCLAKMELLIGSDFQIIIVTSLLIYEQSIALMTFLFKTFDIVPISLCDLVFQESVAL